MSRLNLLLLAAVVLSALALVRTAYESRRLFAAVEKGKAEAERLGTEEVRLQAERHAQATNLRVERVARERLAMKPATPAVTQYLGESAPAAGAAPALAVPPGSPASVPGPVEAAEPGAGGAPAEPTPGEGRSR